MDEIGYEGVKDLKKRLKFGDIVVNHWASDGNPNKIGVFVKLKAKSILVTDMKGKFWEPVFDSQSKLQIIGTVVSDGTKLLN